MKTKTVNILGTKYKVVYENLGNAEYDGYTDYTAKIICVRIDNINDVGDFTALMKKQLRHEVIHAFMAESGLQCNWEHQTQFGHDETTVDWFAIQWCKMCKVFKQLDILEVEKWAE